MNIWDLNILQVFFNTRGKILVLKKNVAFPEFLDLLCVSGHFMQKKFFQKILPDWLKKFHHQFTLFFPYFFTTYSCGKIRFHYIIFTEKNSTLKMHWIMIYRAKGTLCNQKKISRLGSLGSKPWAHFSKPRLDTCKAVYHP